jgi:3-hydroxyisobutyrate dehydrogenase-like beta-hydroxyacid dehydrogenase
MLAEPSRTVPSSGGEVKIGFIGPGRMGRPMLDRLVAAGHDVTVLVRRPQARAAAEADGLTCAGTVTATVRDADAVFVVVLTDEQVRSVCLGPDGAIAAMKPGATLVQHTTSDPATAQTLAEAGAGRGIGVLDAALSGGPHDIAAGRLTLWVGGDEALLGEMRPVLGTYASPIMFVGPPGNGQRVKLVNNALFVAQVGLAIDAVRLAGSLGIGEKAILGAVQHGSGASRALAIVASGGSASVVADRLSDLMLKDVTVVREVAQSAGADLGIIGTVLSSDAVEKKVLHPASAPDRDRPAHDERVH